MSDYTHESKQCKDCKSDLPLDKFRRYPNGSYGSNCRQCIDIRRAERENNPCVYQILNTATGDSYVGATVNPRRRWLSHRSQLRRGKHTNLALQQGWDRHGEASFEFIVLEHTDQLRTGEAYWMDTLRPSYNLDFYLNGQVKHPEETKQKIRKANKGQIPWTKGKTHVEISGPERAAQRREALAQIARENSKPGESNPNAKITQSQANEIRAKYGNPTPGKRKVPGRPRQIDLAREYGIVASEVSRIVRGVGFNNKK